MASEPLFDYLSMDLTQVSVTAEDVGRLNKQSGDMRQLDHVIYHDVPSGHTLGVKYVTDDEFWVPYHIPGRPLYPGVLMIEAAAQLSSIYYRLRGGDGEFLGFMRVDNTIFRGQVVPGDTLYVLTNEIKFSPRRFITDAQGFVDGQMVFETRVTGMVM